MWGYWWGVTCAQLELMLIDQPIIVYDHDKSDKKGADGKREFKRPKATKILEAQLEWERKYGNGQKANAGKGFTFNTTN